MKVIEPPHYSQYLDLKNSSWKVRGCGVVSLKMLMEYWGAQGTHKKDNIPSPDKLYRVGINRRSYVRNIGWRHAGLVGIAKLYGFKSSKIFDLAKQTPQKAFSVLKKEVKKYPVIVSVYSGYHPGKGGHLPVLLSLGKSSAVLLDPNTKNRKKVKIKISREKFNNAWKQRFIVIKP